MSKYTRPLLTLCAIALFTIASGCGANCAALKQKLGYTPDECIEYFK